MKRLVIIGAIIFTAIVHAQPSQPLIVKSIKLDSLIFNGINEYRIDLGKEPVKIFDKGNLRKVSYVLTDLNSSRPSAEFDHTRDPNLKFKGYNAECIYMFERSGKSQLTDTTLTDSELEFLAKATVQAWIDSPNHNYIISAGLIKSVAITSTITIKDNRIRLVVSYHNISG